MLFFSRWKTIFIVGLVALGLVLASPNAMNSSTRSAMPDWLQNTVNLGLDLQGGAHMLLEVDLSSVMQQALVNERTGVLTEFRDAGLRPAQVRIQNEVVVGRMRSAADRDAAMEILREMSTPVDPANIGSPRRTAVSEVGGDGFSVRITEAQIEAIRKRTIDQSIEVLRDRIDPSGTTEMTLVREGDDRILLQVPGAKNIDEIKTAINQTANLSFHLVHNDSNNENALRQAVQTFDPETGQADVPSIGTRYFPEQRGGGLIVEESTRITGECLENSSPGVEPTSGQPVVNFSFNFRCARLFGEMTARNIGRPFAVVLDGEIITAPNIRSAITGGSGYIEGSFTPESAASLSRLLNAGALPAKLLIVEERTVSAELGEASIRAGQVASIIGLIGVALFMWLSYGFRFGTIANLALATNIALIAAALTVLGATLTLPGIAGIILTIGMAVDANVLIFERIREETHNGRPPVNAIETGYRRSLAPILDANITTMIAAITLYFVGSGPVRGFAVTLAIGIVTSVFTAVVFARLLTATWLRGTRPKTLPI
ncbi:MAG: protein translocase subunit SecD [Litorimonas sp.]